MGLELLLALGMPILLLVGGTLYFAARGKFLQVLKLLTSRDAILANVKSYKQYLKDRLLH
jgi:hypothetical protein